jgi:gustatory receptor
MRIGKLFGLFPINVDSKNPQEIIFKWKSPRTFFSLIFIVASSLIAFIVLKSQAENGPLTASNIVGVIFFLSCCIVCVLFFKVSQNFKLLMLNWMETEAYFTSNVYQLSPESWTLKKRILFCTILYLFSSTLEHVCYQLSQMHELWYAMKMCKQTEINLFETYVGRRFGFIIIYLPFRYNNAVGIMLEYLNFSFTFVWNFLDLFIILISIGISFLFEKLNWRLQNYKGLLVNKNVWADIRLDYVKICELLNFVNIIMGEIVIIACFIDGYFMLVQLLNITV